MKKRSKKNKGLIMGICCTAAAILLIGGISGAAGIFSVSRTADSNEALLNQVEALNSNEYKAVAEYNRYLDGLTDEEMEKVIDTSDDAIYEAPGKVKELCETYGLKQASEMTELLSWENVEAAMKERKLTGIMDAAMEKMMKRTAEEYGGGYAFDDGNLYLELDAGGGSKTESPMLISIAISPEGTFPWQGYSVEAEKGAEDGSQLFSCSTKDGEPFACRIDSSEGIAFGKVGSFYLTMVVSKDQSDEQIEQYEKELARAEEQIKKETGLSGMDELEEKVYSGLETAWEKEPEAMQQALDQDDSEQYEALEKKYSQASEEEIQMYETYHKALDEYDKEPELTQEELEAWLNHFNFAKFL